jgi:hypothetical protein
MLPKKVLKLPIVVRLIASIVAVIIASGCLNQGIEEYYSPGWHSSSTENARYRRAFLASPTIVPGELRLEDSMELRVVDAWVERPTHVEYRWGLWRRELQDPRYRLVINLVQVPVGTAQWTYASGRDLASFKLLIEDQAPTYGGNANVQTVWLESETPFPDVIHLRLLESDSEEQAPTSGPLRKEELRR